MLDRHLALLALASLSLLACTGESNDDAATTMSSAETGTSVGDGDGDATLGDGDGAGDGDGDGPGDGDGAGDGDGDGPCHPLMIDCPIGKTCNWDGMDFVCAPAMIAVGDSCDPAMPACVSGFCAPTAELPDCPSLYCCAAFCNLDTPNCQTPGTSCVDYFPDGATTPEVGACLLP